MICPQTPLNTRIAVLQEKQDEMTQAINEIRADIKEIKTMLNANYMTRDETHFICRFYRKSPSIGS